MFWGADLSGARFRDVNLTDAKISHAWLVNVDIDALVDKVVINGVDVTTYVNERDPWYPLRAMLRPSNPEGMRATWVALEDEWAKTITRTKALPEDTLHESVNDEWTFVQTLRHLVFAMDKWFTAPILGERFNPIGLPNTGSIDFPWPGLDHDLTPTVSEALAVRADRATRFATISHRLRRSTSHDRSTCSRTARTRCKSASTPSSKKSSGTTDTHSATSRSWKRGNRDPSRAPTPTHLSPDSREGLAQRRRQRCVATVGRRSPAGTADIPRSRERLAVRPARGPNRR